MLANKSSFSKIQVHGLTIILAFIVFVVITLTMFTSGIIIYFLSKMDVLTRLPEPNRFTMIFFIAILSIIIATVITLIFGHIPLRPINKVIYAINELAKGNFDVRINLDKIPELKTLSDSFNQMAEELGSTELLRNDFINNFSHEFKTPIVSLKGFAKLLKNDNLTKEERDEYLDIIVSESTRLATLSTNVLNITKIENQKIVTEMNSFDLTESIRRSILLLDNQWKKKNLDVVVDLEEVTYYANEELLNHVWVNLIDNAIKFTQDKGSIEISLTELNDDIYFKISDSGCGMSKDVQKHIFEKFYQGDSSHSTPGNGLGLPLVKKILVLHKGSISVTSSEGHGSIFTVIIPKK